MNTKREKFVEELKKLTPGEEHPLTKWKYAGGSSGRHYEFYRGLMPCPQQPEHTDTCLCGTNIIKQRYIQNIFNGQLIVVGSDCIKMFIGDMRRTCQYRINGVLCDKTHQCRKYMICKSCEPMALREYKNRRKDIHYDDYHRALFANIGNHIEKVKKMKQENKRILDLTADLKRIHGLSSKSSEIVNPDYVKALEFELEYLNSGSDDAHSQMIEYQVKCELHHYVSYGKYKYKTYGWILKHDKGYAKWAKTIDEKMEKIYNFIYSD